MLGFALSGLNPKYLLMGAAAGVSIGSAELNAGGVSTAITVFTVLAASTVAVPVISCLVASVRMAGPLELLRAWHVHNNATVISVFLLIIGVITIGKASAASREQWSAESSP